MCVCVCVCVCKRFTKVMTNRNFFFYLILSSDYPQ